MKTITKPMTAKQWSKLSHKQYIDYLSKFAKEQQKRNRDAIRRLREKNYKEIQLEISSSLLQYAIENDLCVFNIRASEYKNADDLMMAISDKLNRTKNNCYLPRNAVFRIVYASPTYKELLET